MRTRRVAGFLVAAAMVVPLGLIASPAGAAGTTTCKTASGTATFSPALPKIGSKTKVKPTVTIKGAKVSGCTGGVKTGTFNASLKFSVASNCDTLLAGAPTGTKGTETITWNTKKTSTVALSLVGVKGHVTQTKASGPVSAGLFKGSKQSGSLNYTLPTGACTTAAIVEGDVQAARADRHQVAEPPVSTDREAPLQRCDGASPRACAGTRDSATVEPWTCRCSTRWAKRCAAWRPPSSARSTTARTRTA